METIIRGFVIYVTLLVIFRVAGKRALSQATTFDLALLLIISETVQQALVGEDFSIATAILLIVTLVGMDILLSLLKLRSPRLDRIIDSMPLVIVEQGKPIKDLMEKSRIDEADVLAAARELQGLERMDQIKYAVLERGGTISIIPQS